MFPPGAILRDKVSSVRVGEPLALFIASLTVRLIVWYVVKDSPPLYDEASYLERADGVRDALRSLRHGSLSFDGALLRAYGEGIWPPVHPFVLGVSKFLSDSVPVARLTSVLVSSATTPCVYVFTHAITDRRAARLAALVHVALPEFVAYSHLLWTESLTCLWLALGLVLLRPHTNPRVSRIVLAGVCLGLSVLTRAAVFPVVVAIVAWRALLGPTRRLRLLVTVAIPVALLPGIWAVTLTLQEGRPAVFSTRSGFNLLLGNNPWVPDGLGSSWGCPDIHSRLEEEVQKYVEQQDPSVDDDVAAQRLAVANVRSEPGTFFRRALTRGWLLWTADFFAVRHAARLLYPSMPPWVLGTLWMAFILSFSAVLSAATIGLVDRGCRRETRALVLLTMLLGSLGPMFTIGVPRFHIPMLLMLLPAAGHGLTVIWNRRRTPRVWALVLALVAATTSASALAVPRVARYWITPSVHYAPLFERISAVGDYEQSYLAE